MTSWFKKSIYIALAIGGCVLLESIASGSLNEYEMRLVALAGLYITLAVSLNLINGITGQFSIGHAAFYQVGAYTAGFLTFNFFAFQGIGHLGWVILMLLIGALFSSFAGLLVGLPSLRLKGDYLAIVTLGFGEIIRIVVQNIEPLGGSYGMNVYPTGFSKIQFVAVIWILAILCITIFRNLLKTAHGLAFLAVRDDEMASAAMGVNVTRVKVTAFVIGSAFAGAAGALLALYEGFITPGTFTMDVSFIILTMVMLGGAGSITGSVIAAIALFYIPEWLREQPDIGGASFLAMILATVGWLALTLQIKKHYHGPKLSRVGMFSAAIVGGLIVKGLATALFNQIPTIAKLSFEGNQLRMVIFAATLIILMLLKPEGLFAGVELSWDSFRRIMRHKSKAEVANS